MRVVCFQHIPFEGPWCLCRDPDGPRSEDRPLPRSSRRLAERSRRLTDRGERTNVGRESDGYGDEETVHPKEQRFMEPSQASGMRQLSHCLEPFADALLGHFQIMCSLKIEPVLR